jgi:hypothetical protein
MRRPKQSVALEVQEPIATVSGHYAQAYVPPSKEFVHEMWRQGLDLDSASIAAGNAFSAVSAFHQGKYNAAIALALEAVSINESWQALFELLLAGGKTDV